MKQRKILVVVLALVLVVIGIFLVYMMLGGNDIDSKYANIIRIINGNDKNALKILGNDYKEISEDFYSYSDKSIDGIIFKEISINTMSKSNETITFTGKIDRNVVIELAKEFNNFYESKSRNNLENENIVCSWNVSKDMELYLTYKGETENAIITRIAYVDSKESIRESLTTDEEIVETSSEETTTAKEVEQEENTEVSINKNTEDILELIRMSFTTEVQNMANNYENTLKEIGESYDTYKDKKEVVTEFYTNALANTQSLYNNIEKTSIDYFKSVASNGLDDYSAWNDSMDDFYDTWDNGMEDYYDAWTDSFENLYDKCDEIVSNAYDTLEYKEYSDAWSAMYNEYSDAWENMYEEYSDAWGNVYEYYTDVWAGFYDDNCDVNEILDLKEYSSDKEEIVTTEEKMTEESTSKEIKSNTEKSNTGISSEFKEAMDSYEAFFDEYVEFMKKYKASDDQLSMMEEYLKYMEQYADTMKKFDEIKNDDLTEEEVSYYSEVSLRISLKIIEVTEY